MSRLHNEEDEEQDSDSTSEPKELSNVAEDEKKPGNPFTKT